MNIVSILGAASDRVTLCLSAHLSESARAVTGQRLSEIRREQLAGVVSMTPVMMSANVVNAVALSLLEHAAGALTFATCVWVFLVCALAARGMIGWRRFRHSPKRSTSSVRSSGKIALSAICLALLWTYPLLTILPGGSPVQFAFVTAVTAGMLAGGVIGFHPAPLAAIVYVAILSAACVPIVASGATVQEAPFAMVISAFVVVVLYASRRHSEAFLAERIGRMEEEARRQDVDLLLDAHQGEGGHVLWRTDRSGAVLRGRAALLRAASLDRSSIDDDAHLTQILSQAIDPELNDDAYELVRTSMAQRSAFDLVVETRTGAFLRLAGRPIADAHSGFAGSHGFVQDVTKEVKARREVERLAQRDSMTGLLNRRTFEEKALTLLAEAESRMAMYLFIDADRLKSINDSFGHAIGDFAICAIGDRLGDVLPKHALIARKGGDEFVAICMIDDRAAGATLAENVVRTLNGPIERGDLSFMLSCSIGVSLRRSGCGDLATMELEADRALYEAKEAGRSGVRIYNALSGEALGRSRKLVHDIRAAVENDELDVVFQPIVNLATNDCLGAEALVRWRHPTFGDVPAQTTAALALDAGVAQRFTIRILRRACAAAVEWDRGVVSVNLCASDLLRREFACEVIGVLLETELPASRLCLEITETAAMSTGPAMEANVQRLRAAGVRFAVDDFGAGYSTMAALDGYPVDVVKIDRSLVSGCDERRSSAIMIKALADLSDEGAFSIVAEGVETLSDRAALARYGIKAAQGNFLSAPLTPGAMALFAMQRAPIGSRAP